MDFRTQTLTVIRDALDMMKNHGIKINIDNIGMNDPEVFRMISDGTPPACSVESSGMTLIFTELKPSSIEDIIAGISCIVLAHGSNTKYVRNKIPAVRYAHPLLERF